MIVTKIKYRLLWKFDMVIYRIFQWRWNKRLRESPELSALFAEWSRRYARAHQPIATEIQITVDEFLNKYEATFRKV